MKYLLDLIWTQPLELEASSREEAVALAKEKYPNHKTDFIMPYGEESGSGVDYCDDCGKPIFDDDEHASDPEFGVILCASCFSELKESDTACDHCKRDIKVKDTRVCDDCGHLGCVNCNGQHACEGMEAESNEG